MQLLICWQETSKFTGKHVNWTLECMHLCFDFLFFNNSHILVTDRMTVLAKFRCYVHAVNCCVSNYTSMKLGADLLHFFSTLCMNLSRKRGWAPTPWWVLDTYSRCLYICWMRQTKGSKTAVALQSDSHAGTLLTVQTSFVDWGIRQAAGTDSCRVYTGVPSLFICPLCTEA